ncbi:unnamed protein product [Peronospora destructor]|uniref:PX domain-containing protein n=1 Tax=Peronospora destructor TaxID=86335 RepID=A0AAV0V081_9STRA|nr:unnamed protein product [Peronospora destructor]
MNMLGMEATVTSCIGGKDEKFAVQVRLAAPVSVYFVYKTMDEFDALWETLENLVKGRNRNSGDEVQTEENKPSRLTKCVTSIVDEYAFREIICDLRAQEKETMSTLNVLLRFLVARVSALFMKRSLLCGSCTVGRELVKVVREFLQEPVISRTEVKSEAIYSLKDGLKRSFEEMRPEDGEEQRSSLFPTRSGSDQTVKTQKMCSMRGWTIPPVNKFGMVVPVASRRRVFAEVEF